MADKEREYVIPLRKEWMKVARYRRTARSIKTIKQFIARHMRVADRDLDKVKLDSFLNNEIWFRGVKHPPTKIRVKAVRDGDIVRVDFVEVPERIKFLKARLEKQHKKVEKKKVEEKKEEKTEEKTDEEKKDEQEKTKSVEESQAKIAEQQARAQKHIAKTEKGPKYHRQALKK